MSTPETPDSLNMNDVEEAPIDSSVPPPKTAMGTRSGSGSHSPSKEPPPSPDSPPRLHPHHSISKIPVEEIKRLMKEYGPSIHLSQHRDSNPVKDDSWKRKFRRWNPHFFDHFVFDETKNQWEPILGEEGEKERRRRIQEGEEDTRARFKEPTPELKQDDSSKAASPMWTTRSQRKRQQAESREVEDGTVSSEFFREAPEQKTPRRTPEKAPPEDIARPQARRHRRAKQPDPSSTHSKRRRAGELVEDDELYCSIWEQEEGGESQGSIGFVILPSPKTATFFHVREAISSQIDSLRDSGTDWKFFIPHLGPVSHAQEGIFGAVLPFLSKRHLAGEAAGLGSLENPLRIHICKTSHP